MRKVREVLRLHFGAGLSARKVAQSCNIGRSTVGEYIQRAQNAGLSWPLPADMGDARLEAALFKRPNYNITRPLPDMSYLHTEMRKKGVTLQLLWHEYKEAHPDGYQYTQFCAHYRRSLQKLDLTLRQEHRAGEKMFADWAGQTTPIVNRHTGEITTASIFVAVLGASNYTYVEAFPSKILANWITAHIHAFEYFNGVAEIVVVDNLKTGVKSPCRYEPDINPAYQDLAAHYGTVVIPTRVRRPRDNAKAEAGVQLVERWILAVLRNRTFFSIAELNTVIRELLERLNNKKFKKLPTTRRELFEKLDRPALKPLPEQRYPFVAWKTAKVNIDYHIEVDRHFYSVPHQLTGERVDIRMGPQVVEVLYKNRRVASHVRSYVPGRATTSPEHRPKAHQKYLEWTPSRIIQWAGKVGPHTKKLVETILASKPHPHVSWGRFC
jgi:transposase